MYENSHTFGLRAEKRACGLFLHPNAVAECYSGLGETDFSTSVHNSHPFSHPLLDLA